MSDTPLTDLFNKAGITNLNLVQISKLIINANNDLSQARELLDSQNKSLENATKFIEEKGKERNKALLLLDQAMDLLGALEPYIHHSLPAQHCGHMKHSEYKCNCGLDELLTKLKEFNKE